MKNRLKKSCQPILFLPNFFFGIGEPRFNPAVNVHINSFSRIIHLRGGARGVIVIVVGNGHGDTSSNPGRD